MKPKSLVILCLWLGFLAIPLASQGQSGCDGVRTIAKCPVTGCAEDPQSAEGLLNRLKNRQARGARPKQLTFADFQKLQEQADDLVGQQVHLKLERADRDKLRNLRVSNGVVAEGSFVKVVGFIASRPAPPHATSKESVNCRLTGQVNNDFHISIVERAGATEFDGVVVEMIPQPRPAGWTVPKLKKVGPRKVLITGSLLYDNEHVVNANRRKPIGGQPKRFSLWEIHPVKDFFVCIRANNACNENQSKEWTKLVDFQP